MLLPEDQYFLLLIQKQLDGTINKSEKLLLEELAFKDENKQVFLNYFKDNLLDKEAIEAQIIYEKTRQIDSRKVKSFKNYRYKPLLLAASVLLIFGVGFNLFQNSKINLINNSEWKLITTGKAEKKSIKLNDGSEIWLNNESVLQIKEGFGKTNRILRFEGEGFFSIVKNPELPVKIYSKNTEIKVLGTKFNLRAIPEENSVTTSLIEGKVQLKVVEKNQSKTYELLPGNKLAVTNKKNESKNNLNKKSSYHSVSLEKIKPIDSEVPEILWMKNRLVFNGDNLTTVVQKMERWFGKPIIINNKKIINEQVTGIFEEKTCEEVLELFKKTGIKLNYYTSNDTLFIN